MAGDSSSNAHVVSLGLLKQWCLSTSRPVESVAGGSILSFFVFSGTHFSISLKHPASITVGLHAHLLRVPGQAGKSKDLGSKEEEARDLTVAFTGFRCDTSHLRNPQSIQELHTPFCAIPLDCSPFTKLHKISSLALHFPAFWGHSHFQQQECAVK